MARKGVTTTSPGETFERTGASVMGKRMFGAGVEPAPDQAPEAAGVRDARFSGGGAGWPWTALRGAHWRIAGPPARIVR